MPGTFDASMHNVVKIEQRTRRYFADHSPDGYYTIEIIATDDKGASVSLTLFCADKDAPPVIKLLDDKVHDSRSR